MPARFAILHHRLDDGEHWDLMLEHGVALLTWQLPREPVDSSSLPMPARRIGDHRLAYLDYEGPVSGGRGTVRRIDAGAVEVQELTESTCRFTLNGSRLTGMFVLERGGEAAWSFRSA